MAYPSNRTRFKTILRSDVKLHLGLRSARVGDGHAGFYLCEGPVGALVPGAYESGPLGSRLDLWKTHFRREIRHAVAFVLAEKLWAGATAPDVYRADNVAVVDEVDDAVVDDIVLVNLQAGNLREGSVLM